MNNIEINNPKKDYIKSGYIKNPAILEKDNKKSGYISRTFYDKHFLAI